MQLLIQFGVIFLDHYFNLLILPGEGLFYVIQRNTKCIVLLSKIAKSVHDATLDERQIDSSSVL